MLRRYFDSISPKVLLKSSEFSKFVHIDLAALFEWKGTRLNRHLIGLEEIYSAVVARHFCPPDDDLVGRRMVGKLDAFRQKLRNCIHNVKILFPWFMRADVESVPNYDMGISATKEENLVAFKKIKDLCFKERPIVVLTANDTEQRVACQYLEPYSDGIVYSSQFFLKKIRLGRYASVPVLLIQSEMGSGGIAGTHSIVHRLFEQLDYLQGFISLGVCFGVNRATQKFGDVVVASLVVPYENQKVQPPWMEREYRSHPVYSGRTLRKVFGSSSFFSLSGCDRSQRVHVGAVLSGEKLINCVTFRDSLVATMDNVVGGEMEGAGLYTSAFGRSSVEVILVKSICDYADGVKCDSWQDYCARIAVQYCIKTIRDNVSDFQILLSGLDQEDVD